MWTCRARSFLLIFFIHLSKVISLFLNIFLFHVPLDLFISSLRTAPKVMACICIYALSVVFESDCRLMHHLFVKLHGFDQPRIDFSMFGWYEYCIKLEDTEILGQWILVKWYCCPASVGGNSSHSCPYNKISKTAYAKSVLPDPGIFCYNRCGLWCNRINCSKSKHYPVNTAVCFYDRPDWSIQNASSYAS